MEERWIVIADAAVCCLQYLTIMAAPLTAALVWWLLGHAACSSYWLARQRMLDRREAEKAVKAEKGSAQPGGAPCSQS